MTPLAALLAAVALAAPPPPTVAGPRSTTSTRPVYTFGARGAVGFRCAFDSTFLHRCKRRYSERLTPGTHVLRVRAVGADRRPSRLTTVTVRIRLPVPELRLGPSVRVGPGAGAPAIGPNAVWVPVTSQGMLARVDSRSGAVGARVRIGPPGGSGDLDTAVIAGDDVWAASDAGATITRVDPATNAVEATLPVAGRPGGLAEGGGYVWAFHFLQATVTRIDTATNAVRTFDVPGAAGTGIAYGGGSVWLLSTRPARLFRLDGATGAVQQTFPLQPPFAPTRSLVDTWWLAFADGRAWATLPNHRALARVDARSGGVAYLRLPWGDPFGFAVGGGSAWVATDRAVWQLDGTTGAPRAAALIPPAGGAGFVSIAFQYGAAWLTTYDRGTVVRVTSPPPG